MKEQGSSEDISMFNIFIYSISAWWLLTIFLLQIHVKGNINAYFVMLSTTSSLSSYTFLQKCRIRNDLRGIVTETNRKALDI